MKASKGALIALLTEDKYFKAPKGRGAEKMIRCFNPNHEDSTPSMAVNVSKGLYHCHGCGISGDAYSYLHYIRALPKDEISTYLLETHAWTPEKIALSASRIKGGEEASQMRPEWTNKLPDNAVSKHEYFNDDGSPAMMFMRFAATRKRKTYAVFTPRSEGGYWKASPMNMGLPEGDRLDLFPLYRLKELKDALYSPETSLNKETRILIVEGEKCVDVLLGVKDYPKDQRPAVTCLFGGSGALIVKSDLSLIYGRPTLLIADADKKGHRFMTRLGEHLYRNGCQVNYILPPGETGYDIADAAVAGKGGWQKIKDWIELSGGEKPHKQSVEIAAATNKKELINLTHIENNEYFRILGIYPGSVIIQNRNTYEIYCERIKSLINIGTLIMFAKLEFWHDLIGGEVNPRSATIIADAIVRVAEKRGFCDYEVGAVGRGLHRTVENDLMFNLGDGLLGASSEGKLIKRLRLDREGPIFAPGPPIKILTDATNEEEDRALLRLFGEAVMEYRFTTNNEARAFVGWLAAAIIGGALPFRPILYLLSYPGSGKSFLFNEIVRPFFGDNMLIESSDPSEPGIMERAKSDSLPLLLDEFYDRGNVNYQLRWKDVMKLLRASTSGGSPRLRAPSQWGKGVARPRFTTMVASSERPPLSEAERQRFFPISLSTHSVPDWPALRKKLKIVTAPDVCLKMRSCIVRNASEILDRAEINEYDYLNRGNDTRQSQILGALDAGAEFITGTAKRLVRRSFISTDQLGPLILILSAKIPWLDGEMMPINELLCRAFFCPITGKWTGPQWLDKPGRKKPPEARKLAEYGISMGTKKQYLLLAPGAPSIQSLLKGTQYEAINLSYFFGRIRGVISPVLNPKGNPMTIAIERKRYRVIGIPGTVAKAAGFVRPNE